MARTRKTAAERIQELQASIAKIQAKEARALFDQSAALKRIAERNDSLADTVRKAKSVLGLSQPGMSAAVRLARYALKTRMMEALVAFSQAAERTSSVLAPHYAAVEAEAISMLENGEDESAVQEHVAQRLANPPETGIDVGAVQDRYLSAKADHDAFNAAVKAGEHQDPTFIARYFGFANWLPDDAAQVAETETENAPAKVEHEEA